MNFRAKTVKESIVVGGDVGNHRNDADGTDGEERQEQAIITRIPGEAGALLLFDGGGEVAGRVLDGFDMLKLGKAVICFDADFLSLTERENSFHSVVSGSFLCIE